MHSTATVFEAIYKSIFLTAFLCITSLSNQAYASIILLEDLRSSSITVNAVEATSAPAESFMDWSGTSVSSSSFSGSISSSSAYSYVDDELTIRQSAFNIGFQITENTTLVLAGDAWVRGLPENGSNGRTFINLVGSDNNTVHKLLWAGINEDSFAYFQYSNTNYIDGYSTGYNNISFSEVIDLSPGNYNFIVDSYTGFPDEGSTGASFNVSFVPLPQSVWLFISGMFFMVAASSRQKKLIQGTAFSK